MSGMEDGGACRAIGSARAAALTTAGTIAVTVVFGPGPPSFLCRLTCCVFHASIGIRPIRAWISGATSSRSGAISPMLQHTVEKCLFRPLSNRTGRQVLCGKAQRSPRSTSSLPFPAGKRSWGKQISSFRRNSTGSPSMLSTDTVRQSRRILAPRASTAALIDFQSSPSRERSRRASKRSRAALRSMSATSLPAASS